MFRPPALVVLLLLLLPASSPLLAKTVPPPPPPPPQHSLNWVPQGFEVLGQRAAFHTDFTFDRSMLQLAGYFVGDSDEGVRTAIAKLDGISVHSYHFAAPGLYDPEALNLIRAQFEAQGWRHLVTAHAKGGDPFNSGKTDLWINFEHMDVTGMMLLIQGSKDLNLVALKGDLSTVDLLHLRGHFGIPRFSGDGFVPGPRDSARQPYVGSGQPDATPDPGPSQYPEQQYPQQQYPQQQYPQQQYPGSVGVGAGVGTQEVEPAPPPPTPPGP